MWRLATVWLVGLFSNLRLVNQFVKEFTTSRFLLLTVLTHAPDSRHRDEFLGVTS